MFTRHTKPHRLDLLGLFVVLLTATILRIGFVGVAEYRKDEAQLTSLNLDIRQGQTIPFLGIPSSIGLPNSPMTVYLLIPPFLLSPSPLVALVYIGLLNVIGVGLLWLIGYRYFGRMVASIAGLAYAVNPWAVLYSRKIWAQDYHTPFILLAIFLALYGFVDKKRWAQIVCLPILLIGLQIHFAAWSLVPVYLWLVIYGRKNTSWRVLGITALLGILVLVPYGIGYIQSRGQFSAVFPSRWYQDLIAEPAQQTASLVTGLQLEGTFARYQAADFLAQVPQPALLWSIEGIFMLLGLIVLWWKAPRHLAVMLTLWAFITMLAVTLIEVLGKTTSIWFESWTHYYIPSIPAFCLLIGIGLAAVGTWRPQTKLMKAVFGLTGGLAVVIFISQFLAVVGLLRYVDTHVTTSGFSFGTPLHYLLDVRDALQTYQDIVVVNGDGRDLPNTGAVIWQSLLHDNGYCIRDLTASNNAAVFPQGSFATLFLPTQSGVDLSRLQAIYQTGTPTTVNLISGEQPAQIVPSKALHWSGTPLTDLSPIRFTNGLTLSGYHLDGSQFTLRWTLPAKSGTDYTLVISYQNADKQVLGQKRVAFWESYNWCPNDSLVNWLTLDPPKATTQLAIGLERRTGNHLAIPTDAGQPTVPIPAS